MIIQADARNIPLGDECVQTVVTSPPYWGLRDYGVSGQIGLEPTPEDYVATMVAVFREVRRVLRDDGTVWLNLGDSYANDTKWGGQSGEKNYTSAGGGYHGQRDRRDTGLKPKDLCGIPWRVAFALQADGWYLRSDIIWAKPNPMPESVTDRPTRAHEYIFLLSKSATYFYDAGAIREPNLESSIQRMMKPWNGETVRGHPSGRAQMVSGGRAGGNAPMANVDPLGRNKRSVWIINSEPTPEAHFATFPQKLIEPCILAGTSEKGCCAECGAPRVRVTERTGGPPNNRFRDGLAGDCKTAHQEGTVAGSALSRLYAKYGYPEIKTTGWRPSCSHDAPSMPCIVLDPFLGSGTVGKVAERFGRRWVGLELSGAYIQIAERRTAQAGLGL